MKILHFGKFYPPFNGGMEVYLRDLSEQQAKTNTVTALVHNHQFGFLKSATKHQFINQVNVIRQSTLKPILFTPIMLGVNKVVNQLIYEDKVDVIHISWPNPSALFLLLNKKAKKKPWVIQWQSDMVTQKSSLLLKLAYRFFKPFERKLLKQASTIIASTKEYADHSIALKNFKQKCHYIPLALKTKKHTINKEDHNWATSLWNNAQYKIYTIGRLTFYKNHQLLIKAAKLLPNAQFIITGIGDHNKITKDQPLNNVIFTGTLSTKKAAALMASCDAFCLPSNDRAESFGMVLLEALSFNKKILVSNLTGSGMKWIANQTTLGETFDCNNAHDLVKLIQSTIPYDTEAQTDLSQFNIENCAAKIDKLYGS